MDTSRVGDNSKSKWKGFTKARSGGFQHDDENIDDDDSVSLGGQTLVTLEEGVRHALAHWKIILLGQILSFLTASAAAAQAGLHLECNVSAPLFTISMTFLVLSFLLIPLYKRRTRQATNDFEKPTLFGIPLRAPVKVYVFLATMEVQASFWTISAFRYTTITSITLLDAISLPTVMILSRFLLHRRYMGVHVLGALVCVTGVVANMLADYTLDWQTAENPYPNKIVGDVFAASGAIMMGVLHVYSEVLVSDVSGPLEYLAVVSCFAFPIAFVASLVFERTESGFAIQESECSVGLTSFLVIASVLIKSVEHVGTASFLYVSEAALLNINLLTTDLWSAVFSVVIERLVPSPIFWVALVVVLLGIFIYEMGPSPSPHSNDLHPFDNMLDMDDQIDLPEYEIT